MRFLLLFICLLTGMSFHPARAQEPEKVKNVILLIPDGTSTSVLSLARWYKYAKSPSDNCRLNLDPFVCGLVHTYSSDAPIGDSAPTGSTYATGQQSQTGFIATYPVSVAGRDLVKLDPKRAYQPLATVLEASQRIGKSTGIVFTCHFPHATPADFTSHTPSRDEYFPIASQMVYNNIDVVIGGGQNYLDPKIRTDNVNLNEVLRSRNYTIANTVSAFHKLGSSDKKVWSLLAKEDFPYDLDRKTLYDTLPSLAEMTGKALQILSQNPSGFFLMVEGSKVDWAAHANDPTGVITEFLAFDDAVKTALDFAQRDGNTAVVICPDHGNSGISMGNSATNKGYDTASLKNIFGPLLNCNLTGSGLSAKLSESPKKLSENEIIDVLHNHFGLTVLSDKERKTIRDSVGSPRYISKYASKILANRTYIGFTTTGHTGEDVFLAMYHPKNTVLRGVVDAREINRYLCEVMQLTSLDSLTAEKFIIDSVLLKEFIWKITDNPVKGKKNTDHYGKIEITKGGKTKSRAVIIGNSDYVTIITGEKQKEIPLHSLCPYVYVEDAFGRKGRLYQHFFLPSDLPEILRKELR